MPVWTNLILQKLSRELKALSQYGLIDRKDYGVVPPKVEYCLTRKGKSFVPVIAAIRNWGEAHLSTIDVDGGEPVAATVATIPMRRRANGRSA